MAFVFRLQCECVPGCWVFACLRLHFHNTPIAAETVLIINNIHFNAFDRNDKSTKGFVLQGLFIGRWRFVYKAIHSAYKHVIAILNAGGEDCNGSGANIEKAQSQICGKMSRHCLIASPENPWGGSMIPFLYRFLRT